MSKKECDMRQIQLFLLQRRPKMTEELSELAKIAKEEEAFKKKKNALRQRKKRALDKLKKEIGSFALEQDKQYIKATESKDEPVDSLYAFNEKYQIVRKGASDEGLERVSEVQDGQSSETLAETTSEEAEKGMVAIPLSDYEYLKQIVASQTQNYGSNWRLERDLLQPFMNELHSRVSEWE